MKGIQIGSTGRQHVKMRLPAWSRSDNVRCRRCQLTTSSTLNCSTIKMQHALSATGGFAHPAAVAKAQQSDRHSEWQLLAETGHELFLCKTDASIAVGSTLPQAGHTDCCSQGDVSKALKLFPLLRSVWDCCYRILCRMMKLAILVVVLFVASFIQPKAAAALDARLMSQTGYSTLSPARQDSTPPSPASVSHHHQQATSTAAEPSDNCVSRHPQHHQGQHLHAHASQLSPQLLYSTSAATSAPSRAADQFDLALADTSTAHTTQEQYFPPASTIQQSPTVSPMFTSLEVDPADIALAQELDIYPAEAALVRVFERVRPCVVNITHMRVMQNFHTLDIHKIPFGQGSGFIWDTKGNVVTNYHVVKGAAEMKVTLSDHTTYTAKLVGYDAAKDIAVLRLSMPKSKVRDLQPVSLGSSSTLRVGQTVLAVGNPFGLDHTLTQGIVSGLGRELSAGLFPIKNVIQTDAAINPGNSGGVLLDSKGRVVGINTAIIDPAGKGSFSGAGFAIPIDTVKGLVEQILQYGRVLRPALGITVAPAQVLEIAGADGLLILEVPVGSPAHAAGLRPTHRDIFGDMVLGDVIVAVDGKPVHHMRDLYDVLDGKRVGDRVRVDIVRDGKSASVTVTLGERNVGITEE